MRFTKITFNGNPLKFYNQQIELRRKRFETVFDQKNPPFRTSQLNNFKINSKMIYHFSESLDTISPKKKDEKVYQTTQSLS